MTIEKLNARNADEHIEYLKQVMSEESEQMTEDRVDEQGTKYRTSDCFFLIIRCHCSQRRIKCRRRIEYHFYGCKMAYAVWVYVLKSYRHRALPDFFSPNLKKIA